MWIRIRLMYKIRILGSSPLQIWLRLILKMRIQIQRIWTFWIRFRKPNLGLSNLKDVDSDHHSNLKNPDHTDEQDLGLYPTISKNTDHDPNSKTCNPAGMYNQTMEIIFALPCLRMILKSDHIQEFALSFTISFSLSLSFFLHIYLSVCLCPVSERPLNLIMYRNLL